MATVIPFAQTVSSPGAALMESIPPAQALPRAVSLPALHLLQPQRQSQDAVLSSALLAPSC